MGYEDVAPLRLLVTEAGGLITDLDGNDVLTGSGTVLATNGHVRDETLGLVHGIPHARDYKVISGGWIWVCRLADALRSGHELRSHSRR
jgi:histidinol-phosphatase